MHSPSVNPSSSWLRPGRVAALLSLVFVLVATAALLASPDSPLRPAPAITDEQAAKESCPANIQHGDPANGPAETLAGTGEPEAEGSEGCVSCHKGIESSHARPNYAKATCVGCHGGNGQATAKAAAHVSPRFPSRWGRKGETFYSGNPEQTYTLLNEEKPEFIRFMNPGDLRIAHLSCGQSGCHGEKNAEYDTNLVRHVRKSMMTHGAMLYGAALYNNGAFPLKNAQFGESYSPTGVPQRLQTIPAPTADAIFWNGLVSYLNPLPRWEISQGGNVLRAFERGGVRKPEVANPLREEEPGKPDPKLSNRGHGTLLRTDPTVLGAQKTRLFDPSLSFLGTNDQPGDYRSSGCSACHNVYANDRGAAAGPYAKYGHWGESFSKDEAMKVARERKERGHPISHRMTAGMPTSQCMSCHIHPGGNMMTTYLGMTWWDNETDGNLMYPDEPLKLTADQKDEVQRRNPEGSALKGRWSDVDFLSKTVDLNPQLKRTQFGDFHSHGWILRKVYKQDRKGNLLNDDGQIVPHDDPDRFRERVVARRPDGTVDLQKQTKAVHLVDIHLEAGMHCSDCHFSRDVHGDGNLYQEPRAAITVDCVDCHGDIYKKAQLDKPGWRSSGPAGGQDMDLYNRVRIGTRVEPRWYRRPDGRLMQRSAVEKGLEWEVVQTRDTIDPSDTRHYNAKSHLAKTISGTVEDWAKSPTKLADLDSKKDYAEIAHGNTRMTCYACHTSWTPSCFGCHLSMSANKKKPQLHNEGGPTRNWTAYNFQTLRDDAFMLGREGTVTASQERRDALKADSKRAGGRYAPVRSSCAILVSSQNANREWIYHQQQTVSSGGLAGTAFSSFVPHTVRGKETKQCVDCHRSPDKNNNAWLANVTLQGTNFYNFMGRYAYVAGGKGFDAVVVSEHDEPQAVIGSKLHALAYPDRYEQHLKRDRLLKRAFEHHGGTQRLQLRGEYLYAAEGKGGLVVYDVANIDNKGFSERLITAPVSPIGQRFFVRTKDAADVAAPSTMALDPARRQFPQNQEPAIHPLYAYIYVADRQEGLILVNAATLLDGNPTNNFLKRSLTWNPGGILDGANCIQVAGHFAFITHRKGLAIVDIDDPLKPKLVEGSTEIKLNEPTSVAVQLHYAFVCDADGLKVISIRAIPDSPPSLVEGDGSVVKLSDAHDVYVVRTYAYVAAGKQGMAIVDIQKPEEPKLLPLYDANGEMNDVRMIRTGMTNNSLYAYVADGKNGLRVVTLLSPDRNPEIYGFSPRPTPELIATFETAEEALAVSEGLDRDRAADESGNQLSVFGRRGARPLMPKDRDKGELDTMLSKIDLEAVDDAIKAAKEKASSRSGLGWLDLLLVALMIGVPALRQRARG